MLAELRISTILEEKINKWWIDFKFIG